MKWHEQMNAAVGAIEGGLPGEIDFSGVARIMGQSAIGFQRTFSIVTGYSVFEYIRRRKMTLAAFELQNSDEKVIDIAMKYGYESPEAFARAFKETHGISPTSARKPGAKLKAFPRITFLLTVKEGVAMDYRIETREAFSVYGIEGIFSMDEDRHMRDIPMFWQACMEDGRFDALVRSTHGEQSGVHAICDYRKTGESTFPYMLFTYRTKGCDAAGYTAVDVPAATWAVFTSEKHTQEETSGVIQGLIRRVYTDWLPTAGYRKVDGYELELYFMSGDGLHCCETWIRVEPK